MSPLGDVGAGHTLGRYELLVPIAQGGMAVVWAARLKGTRGFQKIVAVKSMLPTLSSDPQFEEMFLAEAELASRIKHPNVCEILDLGEQDGTLYIVMEWVDGEPLSTIQKLAKKQGGGVPLSVAAKIGFHTALGLHAAHELKNDDGELVGLVHRDVSPQNVLVTYDGVVKIVDFGVAKATSQAEGDKTKAGQVKGKVPFMSPEQALGRGVDRRTDVFALGIVLYQMVCNKHPFRGDNDMATLHAICDKTPVPPPKSLNASCPEALNDTIVKALEKDVARRYQSMLEFARDLEKAVADLAASGKDQDVAAYVRSVVGDREGKKKAQIKEAIKLAEQRAEQRKLATDTSGSFPALGPVDSARPSLVSDISHVSVQSGARPSVSGVTGIPSVPGPAPASTAAPRPSSPPSGAAFVVTEPAALAASSRPSSGKKAALALAFVAIAGVAAGVAFLGARHSSESQPAAAPAAGPAPVTRAAEPPRAPDPFTEAPPPAPTPSAEPAVVSFGSLEPAASSKSGKPDPAPRTSPAVGAGKQPAKPASQPPGAPATAPTGPRVPQIRDPGF